MRGKLMCKILGHDFRRCLSDNGNPFLRIREWVPSEHCNRCGLTKEECLK